MNDPVSNRPTGNGLYLAAAMTLVHSYNSREDEARRSYFPLVKIKTPKTKEVRKRRTNNKKSKQARKRGRR